MAVKADGFMVTVFIIVLLLIFSALGFIKFPLFQKHRHGPVQDRPRRQDESVGPPQPTAHGVFLINFEPFGQLRHRYPHDPRILQDVYKRQTYRSFVSVVLEFLKSRSDSLGEDLLAELRKTGAEMKTPADAMGLIE